MNDDLCLLITLFQARMMGDSLLRCALRIPHGLNRFDQTDYMLEHAAEIRGLLPEHVRSIGPICAIEKIFEIEQAASPQRARKEEP